MTERPQRKEAVAVRYDAEQDSAPRVLAKGKGPIAERILSLAKSHGIPLYQDDDLVTLLGVLDLDVEVPPRLYAALAEVLAHVYRVDRRVAERAPVKRS
jgi:flagellar biosynthesis protein